MFILVWASINASALLNALYTFFVCFSGNALSSFWCFPALAV